MPTYGDWIDGDDRYATSGSGAGGWTRRWRRYSGAATDLATLVETGWGGGPYTDTFPYTLPPYGAGLIRATQTLSSFINMGPPWNPEGTFQGEWMPTLMRYPVPTTLPLRNPLGYQIAEDGVVLSEVAFGIPSGDWPEGAIGYQYESDYASWLGLPRVQLRPAYANPDIDSNWDHPSRIMLAPEGFANTSTPDASMFPTRGMFSSWEHLWTGVPTVTISSSTSIVSAEYDVPDSRENLVFFIGPDFAFSGSDIRDGRVGSHLGLTLRRDFRMPRHRFIYPGGGIIHLRSHNPAANAGSWPLRAVKNGGHGGSHPVRAV